MAISSYHRLMQSQTDLQIERRAKTKRAELKSIFAEAKLRTDSNPISIAVLGCGDRRFIPYHERIFSVLLQRPVEMVTFDISIEHLSGGAKVIRHDCTTPLKGGPYDICYSHILLKFINQEGQVETVINSYNALKRGGMAIHILNKEDYEGFSEMTSDGYYTVDLKRIEKALDDQYIEYLEAPLDYGKALVLLN